MSEEFKLKVLETTEFILKSVAQDGGVLYMAIKPVITLAKPELRRVVEQNPQEVYNWLKSARDRIDETLNLYEDESN